MPQQYDQKLENNRFSVTQNKMKSVGKNDSEKEQELNINTEKN